MDALEQTETIVAGNGLLFACWAMQIVFVLMLVVFLRSGRRGYGLAMLPLFLPPLGYILSGPLARRLPLFGLPLYESRAVYNVVTGLLACVLLGLSAHAIPGKRSGRVFFVCCAGFVVILTAVLAIRCLEQGHP